jgi:hypothetical protein
MNQFTEEYKNNIVESHDILLRQSITPVEAEILLEFVNDGKKEFDECYPLGEIEKKLKDILSQK